MLTLEFSLIRLASQLQAEKVIAFNNEDYCGHCLSEFPSIEQETRENIEQQMADPTASQQQAAEHNENDDTMEDGQQQTSQEQAFEPTME